jgi:fructokinase
LVKVSAQDARVLYGEAVEHVASHLLHLGVKAVFVTRGADGASIHTATGWTASVGVPNLAGAVTDTIGAGDASLAAIVSRIVGSGSPQSLSDWVRYMRFAMLAAAMTCRVVGGLAAVPSDGGDINGEADGSAEGVTGHDASR